MLRMSQPVNNTAEYYKASIIVNQHVPGSCIIHIFFMNNIYTITYLHNHLFTQSQEMTATNLFHTLNRLLQSQDASIDRKKES